MNFIFSKMSRPALQTTQPPVTRYCDSPGDKAAMAEADHSTQSGAEVVNDRKYSFTPSVRLYGIYSDQLA